MGERNDRAGEAGSLEDKDKPEITSNKGFPRGKNERNQLWE